MHPEFDLDRWLDLPPDDISAVESDWKAVGADLWSAIGRTPKSRTGEA